MTAVAVLLLCSSFATPLSLPSDANVPLDPCREFAKRPGATGEGVSPSSNEVSCSRYHPNVFDGRVCLGCFCDDYEIANWDHFSFAEKACAFEDASDRVQTALSLYDGEKEEGDDDPWFREGSIPVDELKRQASVWRIMAKHDVDTVSKTTDLSTPDAWNVDFQDESYPSESILDPMADGFISLEEGSFVATDRGNRSTISIPSSVTVSSKNILPTAATGSRKQNETISGLIVPMTAAPTSGLQQRLEPLKEVQEKDSQRPTSPPPTPCTRICRYNANCYDGKVCIGCFRDTHDIAQWSSMSHTEKMFSLEDAADRCRELSDAGRYTDTCFEGGISEAALRTQASLWGTWEA